MRCCACNKPITPLWLAKERAFEKLCGECIEASGVNSPEFEKQYPKKHYDNDGEVDHYIEPEDIGVSDMLLTLGVAANDYKKDDEY